MVGIEPPGEDRLPAGPRRDLVLVLHDLYRGAGRPGLRRIANEISRNHDYPDTVSHETVSAILRGEGGPRWSKLECVVRQLAAWHHPRLDPDEQVRRFLALWNAASNPAGSSHSGPGIASFVGDQARRELSVLQSSRPPTVRRPDLGDLVRGVPEVWGTIPNRNKNFTGRSELLINVHKRLMTQSGVGTSLALHGIAGVGKSQVVLEYAYRYKEFYDVVWWIRCEEAGLIESSIAGLAPRLNLPHVGAGLDESAVAVLDALRLGKPYSRWLLIFDAANGPESIRRLLVDGPGHTLITSRDPSWDDVAEMLHVKVFSRADSVQFLDRRIPGIRERDSQALAEALGDLPLALDQAAAFQVKAGMPVSEYLALLEERTSDVLTQTMVGGYPLPVALAWKVSIEQLKESVPDAIELLKCCAFFGPQPIPREVLRGGYDVVTESLGRILRDPIQFSRAITSLSRYSLVSVDMPQRSIQVHRIIQALVRDDLSSEDRERFRHDVQRLLAAATPRDPDDSSTWPRFVELLPHYTPAGMISSNDSDHRLSIRSIIRYQYMAGEFHAALELADSALKQWSQGPDAAPADLLAVKRYRGTVLRALGRYHDAFEVNGAAVAEATQKLGPEHDETLRLTNSHNADVRAAGDFRTAYTLDKVSVKHHIAVFGDRDRATLSTKNNFALDMALMGELKPAKQLHTEVYQLGQEAYGSRNQPSVLLFSTNLARDFCLCGEYSEAYFRTEHNYTVCRDNLGPDHPVTLRVGTDLVIAERLAVGGREETVEHAVDNLTRHRNRYDGSHPATLAAATALVNAWRQAGNLHDALPLAEEITNLALATYGPDHPFRYACMGNLALVLRLSGDAFLAREFHQTSVDKLNVLLGADHYYTLMCAMGLASDLATVGDIPEAESREHDTLGRIRNVLWPDHPMTLACTFNLALDLAAMGREAEANKLRSEALERYAQTLGNDHPATQVASHGERLDFDFDPPRI